MSTVGQIIHGIDHRGPWDPRCLQAVLKRLPQIFIFSGLYLSDLYTLKSAALLVLVVRCVLQSYVGLHSIGYFVFGVDKNRETASATRLFIKTAKLWYCGTQYQSMWDYQVQGSQWTGGGGGHDP